MEDRPGAGAASSSGDGDEPTAAPAGELRSSTRVDAAAERAARALLDRGKYDEAIDVLMKAYSDGLRGQARRNVGDPTLAADVAQQAWLQAWRGLEGYQGRSSLWSWLCGIVYHRSIDALRAGTRAPQPVDGEVLDKLGGAGPGLDAAARLALRRALARCLGKLAPAYRAQVDLRFAQGLSFKEIGEIVGEEPGTVQVRMSRILPKLRRCLEAAGVKR